MSLTRGEDEGGLGEEKLAKEDSHSKRASAGKKAEKGGRNNRADLEEADGLGWVLRLTARGMDLTSRFVL